MLGPSERSRYCRTGESQQELDWRQDRYLAPRVHAMLPPVPLERTALPATETIMSARAPQFLLTLQNTWDMERQWRGHVKE